jgi:HK97 family phage major capsid protein
VAYDNLTSRTDSAALVPEQVARDMLGRVQNEISAVMRMFRNIPVTSSQTRFPILSALPIAYWVTGDTGLKQTSEMAWTNKYLNIEELAVIVPIPQNVFDDLQDNNIDVWGEIQPEVEAAIGNALDSAVLFGTNAPASFPTNVNAAALAAGNSSTMGTALAAAGGVQDDLDVAIGLVEDDGYDPTGIIAKRSLRGNLRRARETTGGRLLGLNADYTNYEGLDISYPARGLWPTAVSTVRAFVGDWTEFVVGVRKDIRMDVFDTGVIQNADGDIVYNLLQQDMIAARFTFRAGWQVSNRINVDQPTEASRYPVARLIAAAS